MNKSNKKDEVVNYILTYIEENQLVAGDKLPTQADLVNTLNISRTTVRETVKELEGQKILKVINGRGMFVQDKRERHLLSGMALEKKKESMIDVLESRWAIETAIIRNIIEHVEDSELVPVRQIVSVLMERYHKNELQNDIDKEFHYALYRCCRNQVLRELIISLGYLTDELWDFPLGMEEPFVNTIPLHEQLFVAIEQRDYFRAKHYNDTIFMMMIDEIKAFHNEGENNETRHFTNKKDTRRS